MKTHFMMMKNALLLAFVVFGFSEAQQQINPITQNGVDITPLVVELKLINAKLALMNQSDSLSSRNIVNILKKIDEKIATIDKKIDAIDKESDDLNELVYEKSASRAKLYYEGIGLKQLATELPKCDSAQGKKAEYHKKYCLDLQERVKKLIEVSLFAIDDKFKMMLQDRVQIINKIFDILLKEKDYLEGISASDKIEDDYRKKAEEREQILMKKLPSR